MSRIEGVVYCDRCGAEITWAPFLRPGTGPLQREEYCCQDCFDGRACQCGEHMELDDERRGSSIAPI